MNVLIAVFSLLFYMVMIAISVGGALWVVRDAPRRGLSAGAWGLLVLFLSFGGLLAYLVVRALRRTPADEG